MQRNRTTLQDGGCPVDEADCFVRGRETAHHRKRTLNGRFLAPRGTGCVAVGISLELHYLLRHMRSPSKVGMADEVIRRTVAALEGDQPAVCRECGQILPGQDRPSHLAAAHGYLEIAGVLLPRPEA